MNDKKADSVNVTHTMIGSRKYYVCSDGNIINERGRVLSQHLRKGYLYVALSDGEGRRKKYSVHRLVAMAFLENKHNLPHVNHKDGNKCNNNVLNLEWVSEAENQLHSRYSLHNQTGYKDAPVLCVETGRRYVSTRDAWRETGCNYAHISECVHGKRQTCGGYHWRNADETLR